MTGYSVTTDGFVRPIGEAPHSIQEADAALYQPLIYTAVFGSEYNFIALAYFLDSLRTFGAYEGTVLVLSEREEEYVLSFLPDTIRSDVIIRQVSSWLHSKYDPILITKTSAPILFIGSNTIVDCDVNHTLLKLFEAGGIHSAIEATARDVTEPARAPPIEVRRDQDDWWGSTLLQRDPECRLRSSLRLNSNLIAYRDHDAFAELSDLMLPLLGNSLLDGTLRAFGDQPFLNYALVASEHLQTTILSESCHFGRRPTDTQRRLGFAAFLWGSDEVKSFEMASYSDAVRLSEATFSDITTDNAAATHQEPVSRRLHTAPYVFIITSALFPMFGSLSIFERFQQTLETITSIRLKVPLAGIVLADSSASPIPRELLRLIENQVDLIVDTRGFNPGFGLRASLGTFQTSDYIKSLSETWLLLAAVLTLKVTLPRASSLRRIFKISGRYSLTEEFDLRAHDRPETVGKFVFKRRDAPFFEDHELLQTRLWSCPGEDIEGLAIFLTKVFFRIFELRADVEHSYFAVLKATELSELDRIGVGGQMAATGYFIRE